MILKSGFVKILRALAGNPNQIPRAGGKKSKILFVIIQRPWPSGRASSAGEPQKGYRLFFLTSLISERRFSISLKVEPEIY
jgi:hypothetical protein